MHVRLFRWIKVDRFVKTVAFSPDGKLLASGDNGSIIRVWDCESFQLQYELNNVSRRTTSIIFSLDSSRIVSRSADNNVRVWDIRAQNCIQGPIPTERVLPYALFDPRFSD